MSARRWTLAITDTRTGHVRHLTFRDPQYRAQCMATLNTTDRYVQRFRSTFPTAAGSAE
jgi:hypothetical protein